MYVAVTRARKRLYLSWAQTRTLHGQTRYCVASSFFDEIPDELLRRINPVTVAQSSRPTYEAPRARQVVAASRRVGYRRSVGQAAGRSAERFEDRHERSSTPSSAWA